MLRKKKILEKQRIQIVALPNFALHLSGEKFSRALLRYLIYTITLTEHNQHENRLSFL